MPWQATPYLVLVLAAAVLAVGWALYGLDRVRRGGRSPHVVAFVVLCLAVAVWTALYGVQLASDTLAAKVLAYKLLHLGGAVVPPAWLAFALAYTDRREWLTPGTIAGLALVPAALLVTLPTNPGSLAIAGYDVVTAGPLRTLETDNGPVYLLFLGYSYVALLLGGLLLVRTAVHYDGPYRRQAALLIGGVAIPLAVSVLEVTGAFPPGGVGINLTPVSLSASVVLFGLAVFRHRVFDLTPMAREAVFAQMRDGVVVLDADERVRDLNPAARRVLGATLDDVGRPAAAVVPRYDDLAGSAGGVLPVAVDGADGPHHLDVSRTPLVDTASAFGGRGSASGGRGSAFGRRGSASGGRGSAERDGAAPVDRADRVRGWTVVLHDVTGREAHRREVQRQNDRLDAFASTVAHDLRNPLNVIAGRTALARETGDPAHLDPIADAAEWMDTFLTDLLDLSRQGRRIDALESVALADAAREAWGVVAVPSATLAVETDATVRADPDRLRQVFQNLFRNSVEHGSTSSRTESDDSVEHGGPSVAVRVIDLDDGFAVADDGPGIPAADREAVLELGYSTTRRGTGLGLNIVHEVVDAHGWSLRIAESRDGGARFEIVGVGAEAPEVEVEGAGADVDGNGAGPDDVDADGRTR